MKINNDHNDYWPITLFNDSGYGVHYITADLGLAEDLQIMFCEVCLEKLIVQSH